MGIRLVYGLKTDDASYLDAFYPARRLREAAEASGLDYDSTVLPPWATIDAALAFCEGHAALVRGDAPMALYEALESICPVVVNGAAATGLAGDKAASAERFAAIGARHPRTVLVDLGSDVPPLKPPFVLKPRFGKMGRGVELVESAEAWRAMARGLRDGDCSEAGGFVSQDYVAQDYVAASRGRDLRFFFARFAGMDGADGEVPPCVTVLRTGPGLASNAHAGGSMGPYAAPDGLADEARRVFADSGLVYGTVDFLFADEPGSSFYVCETNACPGFEAFEACTGLDAAGAILGCVSYAGGTR